MTAPHALIAGLAILAAASLSGCAATATATGTNTGGGPGTGSGGSGSGTDSSWILVGGSDAAGALPVTAGDATLFLGDGGIDGEVCNAFGGDLAGTVGTTSAHEISISEVFSTQMWCEADGLMDLETRYLTALQSATEAQISGGFLHLNGDDVRLRFRQG